MKKRYVEDPSIATCAKIEFDHMHADMCRRYLAGDSFFVARERAMAENGPRIARNYGQETARRALEAMTSIGPTDLPKHVVRAGRLRLAEDLEVACGMRYGGTWRYSAADRWLIERTGISFREPRRVSGEPDPRIAERERAAEHALEVAEAAAAEAERIAAEERKIKKDLRFFARQVERGVIKM